MATDGASAGKKDFWPNIEEAAGAVYFGYMFRQLLNWRTVLAVIAILIVSGTVWYSSYLAAKIEKEERRKVELWVQAGISVSDPANTDTQLPLMITQQNDIPIIATTENDSIIESVNLDTALIENAWKKSDATRTLNTNAYLLDRLEDFKAGRTFIEVPVNVLDSTQRNRYYYGESRLLKEVRWYPIAQLLVVGLFIFITIQALRTSFRSTQNGVWAGMAKETAHQLGTPVSSLEGWVELLKETHSGEDFVHEIEKDVTRLRLVSDRFGKIGSTPQLDERNVVQQVAGMMEYIKKRAGGKVSFALNTPQPVINAKISSPLFDWVIENLLKNALDAMEGRGSIAVDVTEAKDEVVIDVSDTGKGISRQNIAKVFKPGFTTKKRGWGLGLSLSKRIVEQYHQGSLTVKHSEPGKGTTFRIVLKN